MTQIPAFVALQSLVSIGLIALVAWLWTRKDDDK